MSLIQVSLIVVAVSFLCQQKFISPERIKDIFSFPVCKGTPPPLAGAGHENALRVFVFQPRYLAAAAA